MRPLAFLLVAACATQHHEVALQVTGTEVCADSTCETSAAVTISSVVYRSNASEAWQAVPLGGPAPTSVRYALDVDAQYEVVALGTQPPSYGTAASTPVVAELLATADEDASPVLALGTGVLPEPTAPSLPTYAVAVAMQQPGTVYAGSVAASSGTGPWTGTLQLPAGDWDIVALGSAAAAIRHRVRVAGAATLPAFDLDTQGAALVPVTATVDGLVPVTMDLYQPYVGVQLATATTVVVLSTASVSPFPTPPGFTGLGNVASVLAVAPSQLADGDAQTVFVEQPGTGTTQTVYATASGSAQLAVPPIPSPTYTDDLAPTVTWLGPASRVSFQVNRELGLTATSTWLYAYGHAVAIDTSFPGFTPDMLGSGSAAVLSFQMEDVTSTGATQASSTFVGDD
jgi:hypothetical protein